MCDIKEFILDSIQKEYALPSSVNTDAFNYAESGYIDSVGMIRFVVELEDRFGISFTDEELSDPAFKVVGTLARMIQEKMEA